MAAAADIGVPALVYDYLLRSDPSLAQVFQKKTNAVPLQKGSPSLLKVYRQYQSWCAPTKEIRVMSALVQDHSSDSSSAKEGSDIGSADEQPAAKPFNRNAAAAARQKRSKHGHSESGEEQAGQKGKKHKVQTAAERALRPSEAAAPPAEEENVAAATGPAPAAPQVRRAGMETPSIRTLPDEVLALIFSHLSQTEIIRRVLPVCQQWQAVAQSQVLSRGLLLCYFYDGSYNAVSTEEALRLIRAIPNLKSLQLQSRTDKAMLLEAVGSSCTELHRLVVDDCYFEHSAPSAALSSVFHRREQLTDLTVINCDWFSPAELDAVMDSYPHMQQFRTNSTCSDAQSIRLVQRWGSSLQVLKLRAEQLTDAGVAALAGCSQLRSLRLSKLRTPGAGLLQLASLGQLEKFSLLWADSVQPENIRQFFSQSRSAGRLRKIKLRCCGVDDGVLTALAAACPGVEDVDVGCCESVTVAGVRALLRGCRRLLRLAVRGTDSFMEQIVPQLPQLAPQLRRLNITGFLISAHIIHSIAGLLDGSCKI